MVTLVRSQSHVHTLHILRHGAGYNALLHNTAHGEPLWEPPGSAITLAQVAANLSAAKLEDTTTEMWRDLLSDFETEYTTLEPQSITDWTIATISRPRAAQTLPSTAVPTGTTQPTPTLVRATKRAKATKLRKTTQPASTTAIVSGVDGQTSVYCSRDATAAMFAQASVTGTQILLSPPRA